MAQFEVVDRFFIPAPAERVYETLSNPRTFPVWWPGSIHALEVLDETEDGVRFQLIFRGAVLPLSIRLEASLRQVVPGRLLAIEIGGDSSLLEYVLLQPRDQGVDLLFIAVGHVRSPVLRALATAARGLLMWNRNRALDKAARGLCHYLRVGPPEANPRDGRTIRIAKQVLVPGDARDIFQATLEHGSAASWWPHGLPLPTTDAWKHAGSDQHPPHFAYVGELRNGGGQHWLIFEQRSHAVRVTHVGWVSIEKAATDLRATGVRDTDPQPWAVPAVAHNSRTS